MPCVVWNHKKIGDKKTVALVFHTGYISVNGNSSVEDARTNLRKYTRLLQKYGYKVKLSCINMQSISAVGQLCNNVKPDLGHVANILHGTYEPEIFTAACLKYMNMSFLLFASGKIVITGLRRTKRMMKDAKLFLKQIYDNCARVN